MFLHISGNFRSRTAVSSRFEAPRVFYICGVGWGGGAVGAVENEDSGHIEDLVVSYTSRVKIAVSSYLL